MSNTNRIRIIIDATFILNGQPIEEVKKQLQRSLEDSVGGGLLTGDSVVEVEKSLIETVICPTPGESVGPCGTSHEFAGLVSRMSLWDFKKPNGEEHKECECPAWGYLDSHNTLMALILQARELDSGAALATSVVEPALVDGACRQAAAALPFNSLSEQIEKTEPQFKDISNGSSNDMASNCQVSTDDGLTWQNINTAVRVSFRDAAEEDDRMQDLNLTITHEGVIVDVIDQTEGTIVKTAPVDIERLMEMTS